MRLIRRESYSTHTPNFIVMSDSIASDPSFNPSAGTDPFQAAKASAMKAAEELRNAASQKAQELRSTATERAQQFKSAATEHAQDFRDYADKTFTDARERYTDFRAEGEKFVREKPVQAVLAAFGVGLFMGLILRR